MEDVCSYYAVLLINKGLIEGVLEIFHREPFNLNEDLQEFLETLAGQAAITINSAELVNNLANTNYKLIKVYDDTIRG